MKASFEAPRLLLGARSLIGVSLATRDRLLEIVARYREPETLAVTFSKAVDAGVDGVLASPTPLVGAALKELKRAIPVYVMCPTLTEHERNQLDPGIESVLSRRRARGRATPINTFSGSTPFGRDDLLARLPSLVELELSQIPARDVRGVVLDAWLTDIALAAGNRRFFERYGRVVHRFRAVAGLETHNLGMLLRRLREWDAQPDFVIGPLNPRGLMMKPSHQETLDEVAQSKVPVVARELRAGGVVSLEEAARFAHECGAFGLAPDLTEIEDMTGELRGLRAMFSPAASATL